MIRDLAAGMTRRLAWGGGALSTPRTLAAFDAGLDNLSKPPLARWTMRGKVQEAARVHNAALPRHVSRTTRAARRGRRLVPLLALVLVAGLVAAQVALMLSNTARNTAPIVSVNADYAASGVLGPTYYGGVPTPPTDGSIATCGSGVCGNYQRLVVRDYGSLGLTSVRFVVAFSNATAADFAAFSGFWLPVAETCVPGVYTHPMNPAVSGYGCAKVVPAIEFGTIPNLAQWEIAFTLNPESPLTELQMFAWVEGWK